MPASTVSAPAPTGAGVFSRPTSSRHLLGLEGMKRDDLVELLEESQRFRDLLDGPGIPTQHRERVFERFYRADASRTGSHAGLGLSIARWIAAEHGGRIVAGEAALGGASLLVDLPLLRAS